MKLFNWKCKNNPIYKLSEQPIIVRYISSNELLWGKSGVLIWVPNGKGLLKWVHGIENKESISFLLLNDIPLLKWQSYGCPTCEQFLTAGYGIENVDKLTIESIKSVTSLELDLTTEKLLDNINTILKLLKSDLYLISYIPHYPSDGEGNFFWRMSNIKKEYKALSYSWIRKDAPTFLIPTQTLDKLDYTRVNFYRSKIRRGEFVGGIAYYMGGYMSALIDGHHRATAALLEGVPLSCLTIIPPEGVRYGRNKQPEKIIFPGYDLDIQTLSKTITEKVCSNIRYEQLTQIQMSPLLNMISDNWYKEVPKEWDESANQFPTISGIEAIQKAGDLNNERIEDLLQSSDSNQEDNLLNIILALSALRDPRAKDVAKRIASSLKWTAIWREAYKYLATIKTQEIEDFFINFLVNDDKTRPEITKIVDDYFRCFDNA